MSSFNTGTDAVESGQRHGGLTSIAMPSSPTGTTEGASRSSTIRYTGILASPTAIGPHSDATIGAGIAHSQTSDDREHREARARDSAGGSMRTSISSTPSRSASQATSPRSAAVLKRPTSRVIRSFDEVKVTRTINAEEWYEELECGVCTHVLGAPQALVPCGHSLCGPCAWEWIKTHHNLSCPHCRQDLHEALPFVPNIVVDQIIERKLRSLPDSAEKANIIAERQEKNESWKLVQAALYAPRVTKKSGGMFGLFDTSTRASRARSDAHNRRASAHVELGLPIGDADADEQEDSPAPNDFRNTNPSHPFRGGRSLAQVRQDEAAANSADPVGYTAARQSRMQDAEAEHRAARADALQRLIDGEMAARSVARAGGVPRQPITSGTFYARSPPDTRSRLDGVRTDAGPSPSMQSTERGPTIVPSLRPMDSAPNTASSPTTTRPTQRVRILSSNNTHIPGERTATDSTSGAPQANTSTSPNARVTFATPQRSRSSTLERVDRALERSSPRPEGLMNRSRSGSGSAVTPFSLAAVTARATGSSGGDGNGSGNGSANRSFVSRSRTLEARQARGRISGSRDQPLVVLSDDEQ